ncbi:MAG: hypothetical protein HY665_09260, partial [Chloroflexi bacterium]|nr:hypothetical protein [Chloroflexota bacterium]
EVLARNIELPRNDAMKKKNKKVMDVLKSLKKDKVALENVFSNIRRISGHYEQQGEQQKKQAYEGLKRDFEGKVRQAMQQQMGTVPAGMKIDVERQPQFQEEWRRVQTQFDSQYLKVLDEYKQQILNIP